MKLSLVFLVCVATTVLAVQAEKENTRAVYKEMDLKTLEVFPVNYKPKIPSLAPQRAIQKTRVALRKPFVATPEEREKRQTEAELRFIARQHSSDDDERMTQLVTAILLKNYPADQETISNALKAAKVEIGALFKDDRMIEVLHRKNVAHLVYIIEAVRVARKQLDLETAVSTGKRYAVAHLLQDKASYPERSLQNLVDKVPMSGPDGSLILRNLLTRFDDSVNLEPSMDAAVQKNDMELLMFLLNDKRADSAILNVFHKAVSNENAAAIEVFIRSDKIREDEPGFELAFEIFQDAELQKVADVLEIKEMNHAIERKDMERLKSLVDDNFDKSLLLKVFRDAVRNKKKAAIKVFIRSGKITEVDCREPGLEFARSAKNCR